MTSANMKLVMLKVTFDDELQLSEAKLDEGEHIVKRVVELDQLHHELSGEFVCSPNFPNEFLQLSRVQLDRV